MPEGMNVEISHKLSEHEEEKERRKARWEVLAEIIEVAVLAIVAIATAWSGYQAARWDGQHPFTNPTAPPGPGYMPQYRNLSFESADRLNALASVTFNQGTVARDTAERYVRDTVLFASVLFLVAIAQRFKVRSVRIATTTIAFGLAAYTTVAVATLPRI